MRFPRSASARQWRLIALVALLGLAVVSVLNRFSYVVQAQFVVRDRSWEATGDGIIGAIAAAAMPFLRACINSSEISTANAVTNASRPTLSEFVSLSTAINTTVRPVTPVNSTPITPVTSEQVVTLFRAKEAMALEHQVKHRCPKHKVKQVLANNSKSNHCDPGAQAGGSAKQTLHHPITVVTAYYTVRSRHPRSRYLQWLRLLLKIETPIAFFSNCETLTNGADIVDTLEAREKLLPGRLVADILEPEETRLAQKFARVLQTQEARDPERYLGHNYRLSLVWLVKVEALMAAIRDNPFCSEWFLWVDSGAFRQEHTMRRWPSLERLALVPKDRALCELVNPFPGQGWSMKETLPGRDIRQWIAEHQRSFYKDHVAAGFIGLNVKGDFHLKFYKMLTDTYQLLANHDVLIVKEQNVLNAMFLMHPHIFAAIPCNWECGDLWFHAQPWLASQTENACRVRSPLVMIQ